MHVLVVRNIVCIHSNTCLSNITYVSFELFDIYGHSRIPAPVGAIGIGTAIQSVHALCVMRHCDTDDAGQSFHDANGDLHSNGQA